MTQAAVESFLGRVITDERFRNRAKIAIENTCFSEGYCLSNTEIEYLKSIDLKIISLVATTLDDSLIRH